MQQWFRRFAYAGCLPSDTESEQLKKAILVSIPTLISILSIFWVSGYLLLDRPLSAAIPGSYAVFSLLSVFVFFKTKHYGFFRFSQLFLILWLPFLLQWSLGGFNNGSVVMIWAILSPIGALMFHGVRQAIPWFLAYLALTAVSGVFDNQLAAAVPPLPDTVTTVFYAMNLGGTTLLVYAVVSYFVVDNQRIIAAVSAEKAKTESALSDTEKARAVIEEQANKLIEMDRVKTRFFSNISHEFRTPLTLIIGPLEDCLAGSSKPPQSQLEVMLRNCRRLLRLINQLLDIARLEAGGMKLTVRNGNLTQFIQGTVRSFTPAAERNGIHLQFSTNGEDVECFFDAGKIEKVFSNLLSNALKFTAQGGKIHVDIATISDRNKVKSLRITVKDTGHGIPKEELPYIFDRFRQVDGSSTREHEGTGIGLALAKELVTLQGGTIDVNSEPGFGTAFTVTLPLRMDSLEGARQAAPDEEMPIEYDTLTDVIKSELSALEQHLVRQGCDALPGGQHSDDAQTGKDTILVIDDNPDIRSYLVDCLGPHYHVIQAGDGTEGLRIARESVPDLVICDIMMPGMDGYEVCRELKSDQRLNHIPLIFLTAKASRDMKVEGLEVGADDYVAKPFNTKELLVRCRNLLTLRKQEKELKILNQSLEEKLQDQLEELIKTRRLTSYFSGKLLNRILSDEDAAALVTERRNITIFFCDLCNYTDLTDRLEVEKTTLLLNEYLTEVSALVEQYGATTIQIIGDGIMAFFGAPVEMDNKEQAAQAVQLGIAMQRVTEALSRKCLDMGIEYRALTRIGIHQDFVTVGNFGSHNLMEYTAVGKGVNLASRLETSCTPGLIKVSYPVYLLTCDEFPYEPLHEERFKGFARQLKVCELNPSKGVGDK